MEIDWGTNIVLPEYIDEILNLFNMETIRTVLVAWKRLKQESIIFDIWWVRPQEWFYQSCIPWYVDPDMSDALKGYKHSYDDCWTIVKIFLCTFKELRICSVCRSDKWLIVRYYIVFVTYTGNILSKFCAICFEL
jgi:hypothetical protein